MTVLEGFQILAWFFFFGSTLVSLLVMSRLRRIVYNHLRHRRTASFPLPRRSGDPSSEKEPSVTGDDRHPPTLRLTLFVALNLLDLILSFWSLKKGLALELNPIARLLLTFGPFWFVLFKTGATVVASFLLYLVHRSSPRLGNWALDSVNAIVAFVLICVYGQVCVGIVR